MYHCLICQNKTSKPFRSICQGCRNLLSHPKYDCTQCGSELQQEHKLCGNCQKASPYFSQVKYACVYQQPIDNWVKSLKFSGKIHMSRLFAEAMLAQLNQYDSCYTLMPVPLHVSRLRKRGYNQAYEIAKELAKISQFKLNNCLIRTKNTAMQAQLKLNQRAKNISKAFSVKNSLEDKKIILIDDVMTSGYTLNECAKTLFKAGAEDVKVLVFARKSL